MSDEVYKNMKSEILLKIIIIVIDKETGVW